MSARLEFEIIENEGRFVFPAAAEQPYRSLLDSLVSESSTDNEFVWSLQALHREEPQNLGVIASLAAHYASDEPETALEYAEKGLALAAALIPTDFTGTMDWREESNHTYFALLHSAIVANMFMGDNDEAWRPINHSLTLNPRDHLSVRLFRDQLPAYVAH